MVQHTAYITLRVYEKAPKKSFYRPVSFGSGNSRRLAVIGVSTVASVCKRLLEHVAVDALYDFTTDETNVNIPHDVNEFCAEDVAQSAVGFVKGEVCCQLVLLHVARVSLSRSNTRTVVTLNMLDLYTAGCFQ
jgi:hypothetical protein